MPVVLVCLKNFQEYILTNIQQLIRLGHKEIYVLTNVELFSYFENYLNEIVENYLLKFQAALLFYLLLKYPSSLVVLKN
jgi:hypothetical protein